MHTLNQQPEFDVAIIGGGPAGAATAAYLARAGLRCLVLEKERFPRPHVGESLVPATTRVFKELGFLEKMEQAGFVRKYGAAWTSEANAEIYAHTFEDLAIDCQVDIRFDEREQEGVDQNYTYHVDRAKFDQLLLEHAAGLGATVWQDATVQRVDFSAQPYVKISCRFNGKKKGTSARMVVDASGRRTFLGNQLRLKIKDPKFDQYALHTWFDAFDRGNTEKTDQRHQTRCPDHTWFDAFDRGNTEKSDYIFIHFLPVSNTWVWQIPITETITSFGAVTQKENFAKARTCREDFFWGCIQSRPELYEKLKQAKQLRPLKAEGDYSYNMRQFSGDRFVLVGDAARFVDPIFSSGVSIALNSARLASRDILRAFEIGDFGRNAFRDFENTMRRGCNTWYEFISLYYRLNLLFTYFVNIPKYRYDILRLLQGDVYDKQTPEVLIKMRAMVTEAEQNPKHVWHGFLGTFSG